LPSAETFVHIRHYTYDVTREFYELFSLDSRYADNWDYPGVAEMPFLLWVVYPYAIWMGCYGLMLEQGPARGVKR
jgi:hypothetical protein